MLYNPKWEVKAKEKPTLVGFIEWLETKDPAAHYNWYDCNGSCAIGQYLTSLGIQWNSWEGSKYYRAIERPRGYPQFGVPGIAYERPHTFGAALGRSRAAQALAEEA